MGREGSGVQQWVAGGSHRPCLLLLTQCALSVQVGTGDLDDFQADTEEEDDDEGDCVIMDISDVGGEQSTTPSSFPSSRPGREGAVSHPPARIL